MSVRITKFLTDWLRWNVVNRIGGPEDVSALADRCLRDARRQGISSSDIERAIGSVDECIRQSLLQKQK